MLLSTSKQAHKREAQGSHQKPLEDSPPFTPSEGILENLKRPVIYFLGKVLMEGQICGLIVCYERHDVEVCAVLGRERAFVCQGLSVSGDSIGYVRWE